MIDRFATLYRPAAALAALLVTGPASAAEGPGSLLGIAGVVTGLLGIGLAAKFFVDRRGSIQREKDLGQRLELSEKTVARLQSERGALERTVAQRDAALTDIEEQRSQAQEMLNTLREQVERVARIDGLTGVANHQHCVETLDDEIKRHVRQRKPFSLLLTEIDFFDDYTDIHGTERSDYALQRVAACISQSFRRAGDLVARVGSDRFAVILPEADADTGHRFAEKLRRAIYGLCIPFPGSDAADRITVSVGVATVPPTRVHEREFVMAMAENALNHAQAGGHNQTVAAEQAAA